MGLHSMADESMNLRTQEFIEGEDCCNMTSKKLRLKGTRETATWMDILGVSAYPFNW